MGGDINNFWSCGWYEYTALLNVWDMKNGNTKEQKGIYTEKELDSMYKNMAEKLNGIETRNSTS